VLGGSVRFAVWRYIPVCFVESKTISLVDKQHGIKLPFTTSWAKNFKSNQDIFHSSQA
jgi:hypothetical protein